MVPSMVITLKAKRNARVNLMWQLSFIELESYIMASGAGILSSGDGSQADKDSDEDFHFSTFLFNRQKRHF